MLPFVSESGPEGFSKNCSIDYNEVGTLYPSAVQASHRDSMMPRSWNDFGPFSFAPISTVLGDSVAGEGSGDGCREGFRAS